MKKLLLLTLLWGAFLAAQAQDGIHKGLVRVQGTVGLGISKPELRYYVLGELEGLLTDHVGINGAIYANLGSDRSAFDIYFSEPKPDDYYVHTIFAGPIYHFTPNKPLDVHVGVQPGISLTQLNYMPPSGTVATEFDVAPAASVLTGVAYYGSIFHLFAQARYVVTRHTTVHGDVPLNDLRLAIGLGFNFN
jgi:hypothetical protein